MSRLLLIRHGQTTSNIRHALDTALPGAALTDLGWSQARAAGELLASETVGGLDAPLALVSSEALRARQTAAGISAAGVELGLSLAPTSPGSDFASSLAASVTITDGLAHDQIEGPSSSATAAAPAAFGGGGRDATSLDTSFVSSPPLVMPGAVPGISEIPAGRYEMRVDEEAHHDYHLTFHRWLGGSLSQPMPGALDGEAVVGRYLDSLLPMLAAVQREGSDLAVVSHGAVIRLVAAYLGRVQPQFAVDTLLPNTGRVELEVPDLGVPDLAALAAPTAPAFSDAVQEGWKVTDWAGLGEPPRG